MWLAHSARRGKPAQLYGEHVVGVVNKAEINVNKILQFCTTRNKESYVDIVRQGAYYHDLGKLAAENQAVLRGEVVSGILPVEHRDAGIRHLLGLKKERADATLVYAHHWPGLPNLSDETSNEYPFRCRKAMENTAKFLEEYVRLHKELTPELEVNEGDFQLRLSALEYRFLLSCLVDADYSDTAGVDLIAPAPRWGERLTRLDEYIAKLGGNTTDYDSDRNKHRAKLYECCKSKPYNDNLEYCDSPVGTGKTTAIMARALKIAKERKFRHVFVVLPYTNIISQTVKVFREALILEGEDPFQVVAEHHHQADFESLEYRSLASTWMSPIIVTTAVQFFETLAANKPAKLRKVHQLPGSCVVVDESHAALPAELMPVAWRWLNDLTENWGCYVCLCSGTSCKFWRNEGFIKKEVPPIVADNLSKELQGFEENRLMLNVRNNIVPHLKGRSALINYIEQFKGPRIVVMNTVRNAAYLAKTIKNKKKDVLHLSTALTPRDRERVIEEVTNRLKTYSNYSKNWTLVATSCVECGMNFSFRNGFCELRSVQSFLQLAGRVNRNGEYEDSFLNCFTITDDNFNTNPSFEISQSVFRKLIELDAINKYSITDLVSKSFEIECKQKGGLFESISKAERQKRFVDVADKFKVISENTVTVLVDPDLIDKIKKGLTVSNRELQRGSVNLRHSLLKKLGVSKESELPYLSNNQYDDFLGYMKTL